LKKVSLQVYRFIEQTIDSSSGKNASIFLMRRRGMTFVCSADERFLPVKKMFKALVHAGSLFIKTRVLFSLCKSMSRKDYCKF